MSFAENLARAQQAAPLPEGFVAVESSNIAGLRFEPSARQTMELINGKSQKVGHVEVHFKNGLTWRYGYLRDTDFHRWLQAPSIGKYFHKEIKARVAKGELTAKLLSKP